VPLLWVCLLDALSLLHVGISVALVLLLRQLCPSFGFIVSTTSKVPIKQILTKKLAFPLSVYGPIVLPLLAVYIVLAMEAIGDITATCDVSRLQVDGKLFDSRIQGGVLADGLNGIMAGLCTITPMSTFAQVSLDISHIAK
jgi:xanthine/uracil permease